MSPDSCWGQCSVYFSATLLKLAVHLEEAPHENYFLIYLLVFIVHNYSTEFSISGHNFFRDTAMYDYSRAHRSWCRHLGLSNLLQSSMLWGNSAGHRGEILTSTIVACTKIVFMCWMLKLLIILLDYNYLLNLRKVVSVMETIRNPFPHRSYFRTCSYLLYKNLRI